jgi:hypothetical protein
MVTGVTIIFYRYRHVRRKTLNIYSISIGIFFALSCISGKAGQGTAGFIDSKPDPSFPAVVIAGKAASHLQNEIVLQEGIGQCACGPCSIFNAFQFGNAALTNLAWSLPGKTRADKVRSLIDRFGGKPSALARNQPRYLADGGMWGADIAPLINDWLDGSAPPVRGERLTLQWNETPRKQVRRVYGELHRSLQQGFPPVINVQSYTAPQNARAGWTWLDGHFVTVVAVQDSLAKRATGFSMWVADSESGHVIQVSVSAGQDQPFRAITSEKVDKNGTEIDGWTQGHPYLTIQSSKLEGILEGDAASPQTVCVLQYVARR